MTTNITTKLRVFCVYEPSYWRGFLVTIGSLVRHASAPLTIDVLLRAQYTDHCRSKVDRLRELVGQSAIINLVEIPADILKFCDDFKFTSHFIPEVLFRLYYFEIVHVSEDFVVHIDLDMIWRGDILSIISDFKGNKLIAAVEDDLPDASVPQMPEGVTTYLNAGLLLFRSTDLSALKKCMAEIRSVLPSISGRSVYVDQDAINIVMHDRLHYLPNKWNFMTKDLKRSSAEHALNLHATGSRKPWHFRGGHPFVPYYEDLRRVLNMSYLEAYDIFWAPKKVLRSVVRALLSN